MHKLIPVDVVVVWKSNRLSVLQDQIIDRNWRREYKKTPKILRKSVMWENSTVDMKGVKRGVSLNKSSDFRETSGDDRTREEKTRTKECGTWGMKYLLRQNKIEDSTINSMNSSQCHFQFEPPKSNFNL